MKDLSSISFLKVFDNNHAPQLLIDTKDGAIIRANQAALDFYGYSQNEIIEITIQEINTLSDKDVSEAIKKAKANDNSFFQFRHKLKDGKIKDVEVYVTRVELKNRVYLNSIVHDISSQVKVNNDLKEAKLFSENIISSSNAIVIGLDSNHRAILYNKAAKK